MKKLILFLLFMSIGVPVFCQSYGKKLSPYKHIAVTRFSSDTFLVFEVDLKVYNTNIYWKDTDNNIFKYFYNLKLRLESLNKEVLFMTNAGMYLENYYPLGLLIQEGKIVKKLNLASNSEGNFYKKPNGVFCITYDNTAYISSSETFTYSKNIKCATQSGPMLVIDGELNPILNKPSHQIKRNGVGILPNNNVIFVLTKTGVTFKQFTQFFVSKGCKNVLSFDGNVSDAYYPARGEYLGASSFGPIIAITK